MEVGWEEEVRKEQARLKRVYSRRKKAGTLPFTEIRYLTPEEEKEQPNLLGQVRVTNPLVPYSVREVILKRSLGTKKLGSVLAHEFGHEKYPWYSFPEPPEAREETKEAGRTRREAEIDTEWLFNELVASYYALTVRPGDKSIINFIKLDKKNAEKVGVPSLYISRIDQVARTRVGYKGQEIR